LVDVIRGYVFDLEPEDPEWWHDQSPYLGVEFQPGGMRGRIAELTGLALDKVMLRSFLFGVSSGSFDLGKAGFVAGDDGVMFRTDKVYADERRLRVCKFDLGREVTLIADQIIVGDGTLYVPVKLDDRRSVLVLNIGEHAEAEWEADYAAIQSEFRTGVETIVVEPRLDLAAAETLTDCE
jgi:hypothetical protein